MQPSENSLARLGGIKCADAQELSKAIIGDRAGRHSQSWPQEDMHKGIHCILLILTQGGHTPSLEKQVSQHVVGGKLRNGKYSTAVRKKEVRPKSAAAADLRNDAEDFPGGPVVKNLCALQETQV